jgi:hypothetical protein
MLPKKTAQSILPMTALFLGTRDNCSYLPMWQRLGLRAVHLCFAVLWSEIPAWWAGVSSVCWINLDAGFARNPT